MKNRHFPLIYALFLGIFASAALGGCGIKPGSVSPPEGAENSGFPHTYPKPSEN